MVEQHEDNGSSVMSDINEDAINASKLVDSLLSLIKGLTTPLTPQRMLPSVSSLDLPSPEENVVNGTETPENILSDDTLSLETLESEGGIVFPDTIPDYVPSEEIPANTKPFTGGFNLSPADNAMDGDDYDIAPGEKTRTETATEDDGFELEPDAQWTPPTVFAPIVASPESEPSFFLAPPPEGSPATDRPAPEGLNGFENISGPVPVPTTDPTQSFALKDVDLEVVENNQDSATSYGMSSPDSHTPIVFGATETYEIEDPNAPEESAETHHEYVPFQAGAAEMVNGLTELQEDAPQETDEDDFDPAQYLSNFDPSRYLGAQQEQIPVSVVPVDYDSQDSEYSEGGSVEGASLVPVLTLAKGGHSVAQMIKELEDLRVR